MIQLQYLSRALKMTNAPDSNLPARSINSYNQTVSSNLVSASAMDSSYISPHFPQNNQSVNFNGNLNLQSPYYSSSCLHFNQPVVQANIISNNYQHPYQGTSSYAQQSAPNYYSEDYGTSNPNVDPNLSSSLNTPTIENQFSPNSGYYSPNIYNSRSSYIQQPTASSATQLQQNSGYLSSEYYLTNYHSAAAAAAAAAAVAANQESNSQEPQIQKQNQSYYLNNSHSLTHQIYHDERKEKTNSGAQINTFANNHSQAEGEIVASGSLSSAAFVNGIPCEQITGELESEADPTATRATTTPAEGMRAPQPNRPERFRTPNRVYFDSNFSSTCCASQSIRIPSAVEASGHGRTSAYSSAPSVESLPVCEASQHYQQQQLQQQQQQQQHRQQALGRPSAGAATTTSQQYYDPDSLDFNFLSQTQETSDHQARPFSDEISSRQQQQTTGERLRTLPTVGRFSDCTMSKQQQSLLPQQQQQQQQQQHLQARATQMVRPKTFHLTNNQQPRAPYLSNNQNLSGSSLRQAISGEQQRRVNDGISATSCNNNSKQTSSGKSQTTTGAQQVISRRKNATRETTAALKEWLDEHGQNPYPTKGEKIMLSIITKMTLVQVSTWFANARRRMKKENKIFWGNKQQAAAAAAAAIAATNANVQIEHRLGKTVPRSSNSVFGYLFQKHHKHIQAPNSMLALSTTAKATASTVTRNNTSSSGNDNNNNLLVSRATNCQKPRRELEQYSPHCRKASSRSFAKYELSSVGQTEIGSSAKGEHDKSESGAADLDKQEDKTREERIVVSSSTTSPDSSSSSASSSSASSSSTVASSTLTMAILSSSVPIKRSLSTRAGESNNNQEREEEEKNDLDSNISDKKTKP